MVAHVHDSPKKPQLFPVSALVRDPKRNAASLADRSHATHVPELGGCWLDVGG